MKQRPIYLFSLTSHDGATHVNSLHVSYFTPEIDFKKYDYLIITSKQVLQALETYNEEWKKLDVLAVSNVTAKAVKNEGGNILKYGSGYGENLVEIICSYPKEKRWLYLRAKEVASDFASVCREKGCSIDEAVMYETSCSHDILHTKVEENATLIFTSPSSVNCFLKHHMFKDTHNIVVIGKTTAKAMPYHVNYKIADVPTMQSCIQKAKE
ncbi:uroporphyrinogen-III synthase [Sulfurimonas sp. HSL-1716]|uniref:uroporphyrinogen-III synthase n=1 Tax=Hydrocurvibacter sulfurireducens TaxID=3131937 RepID=UPI0031F9B668